MWPFPCDDDYDEDLKSDVADVLQVRRALLRYLSLLAPSPLPHRRRRPPGAPSPTSPLPCLSPSYTSCLCVCFWCAEPYFTSPIIEPPATHTHGDPSTSHSPRTYISPPLPRIASQCRQATEADHIYAFSFLRRFVNPAVPWVHLDLASAHRAGGLGHVDRYVRPPSITMPAHTGSSPSLPITPHRSHPQPTSHIPHPTPGAFACRCCAATTRGPACAPPSVSSASCCDLSYLCPFGQPTVIERERWRGARYARTLLPPILLITT